jgi:hypothetical protein
MQTPYAAEPTHVPTHLAEAIIATLLCCWPLGLVAIIQATKVSSRNAVGDVEGAMEASRKAKLWSWIAIASGFVVIVLYVALLIAMEGDLGSSSGGFDWD